MTTKVALHEQRIKLIRKRRKPRQFGAKSSPILTIEHPKRQNKIHAATMGCRCFRDT
ncbi:MAG: hypothetical protein ACTSRK_07750 [Promethearchaeota archaeon]